MNKKLQVFVSSTYTDLIEERQIAVEAILDTGHIPAGMELFKAGKSQMRTIKKWIDDSDVYMLILGGRYGSIEEESGLSYTELEYRYALSKNMPVFAIVLDDSFLFTKAAAIGKDSVFEKENIDKYENFKKYIQTKIVYYIHNIDQIASSIQKQLNFILNDDECLLVGWIRSNKASVLINDNLTLKELIDFKKIINQRIANNLFSDEYAKYAVDYSIVFDEMLLTTLKQQTFIDRFSRQVTIFINGKSAYVEMKTHIQYINIKNTIFYKTSPIFPTEEQAKSYEHLEFKIDNIDYTDKIKKEIVINNNNKQMCYLVKNQYPINRDYGNMTIFHKVKYKVDIDNFYQLYSIAYPCRDFDVSIILEGKDKEKYRLILGTHEYFNVTSYSEKTQIRNKQTCFIRLPHWILNGSGYNFTIQKER